nr:hypothetical protein [Pseudomonas luteola]
MDNFEHFSATLTHMTPVWSAGLPMELMLGSEGDLQTFYAPFDYVNQQARVTICGITPGFEQARQALKEAQKQLRSGATLEQAKKAAKEAASFAGPLRKNLVAMLDHVGLNTMLGITSCARLFDTHTHLVHYTSALRYPVFVGGKNYSGSPSMLRRATLLKQVKDHLAEEIKALGPECIYVPLGPKVAEVFEYLQSKGLLRREQILNGLPHPSGENGERINYFLGKKSREALSSKTNPAVIDAAKSQILSKLSMMNPLLQS